MVSFRDSGLAGIDHFFCASAGTGMGGGYWCLTRPTSRASRGHHGTGRWARRRSSARATPAVRISVLGKVGREGVAEVSRNTHCQAQSLPAERSSLRPCRFAPDFGAHDTPGTGAPSCRPANRDPRVAERPSVHRGCPWRTWTPLRHAAVQRISSRANLEQAWALVASRGERQRPRSSLSSGALFSGVSSDLPEDLGDHPGIEDEGEDPRQRRLADGPAPRSSTRRSSAPSSRRRPGPRGTAGCRGLLDSTPHDRP